MAVVFHGIEVGESAHVCCATWVPSTLMVQVGVPWKLCGHTMTQLVPLTVSPFRGGVMSTVSGVLDCCAPMLVVQPRLAAAFIDTAAAQATTRILGSSA